MPLSTPTSSVAVLRGAPGPVELAVALLVLASARPRTRRPSADRHEPAPWTSVRYRTPGSWRSPARPSAASAWARQQDR
ncbi:acyl-CoA carboxylase epsilon subunit [Streptomyces sp. XY431]|uniref:acyl-CoA carboxylase epsilon subunit n=1 Tax=Streptomyces sp. XY431 TaxID=1415562 RepID=UPI0013311589|nr:acyl-CoA carboxylase epsilon subunit [Streptomyces sp. XY431]